MISIKKTVGVGALFIAGLAAWLCLRPGEPQAAASDRSRPTAVAGKAFLTKPLAEAATPEFTPDDLASFKQHRSALLSEKWDRSRLSALLDGYRRDSKLLVAAYFLSRNVDFLHEAIAADPANPTPLLLMGVHSSLPPGQRLDFLQRFCALDKENALGPMLLAAHHVKNESYEEGIAALTKAFTLPKFSTHQMEISNSIKEIALVSGQSDIDSSVTALRPEGGMPIYPALMALSRNLQKNATLLNVPPEAVASLGAGMALRMRQLKNESPVNNWIANNLESAFLRSAPEDALYGDAGITVSQRLKQLEDDTAGLQTLMNSGEKYLQAATPVEYHLFMDKYQHYGGMAAYQWLAERNQPEQQ